MFKKIIVAVFLFAVSDSQSRAMADSFGCPEGLGLKKESHFACILDPEDEYNLYCPVKGWSTAAVKVTNKAGAKVSVSYEEWHSNCGVEGGKVRSQLFEIDAHQARSLLVMAAGKNISGQPCRQVYLTNCHAGGKKIKCSDGLSAEFMTYIGNLQ